jgi:hypothetical protein
MPSLFDPGGTFGLPVTTRTGISYEVDTFDYRERWTPGANSTVVLCRVPFNTSFDWITDMVGRAHVVSSVGGKRLRRDLPEQNPYDRRQYCTRVEQVDQGGDPDGGTLVVGSGSFAVPTYADVEHGWPVVKWCRYRCTFEAFPFQMRTDAQVDNATAGAAELYRYVMRVQRPTPREQQIPAGAFQTIDDAVEGNRIKLMQTGFKTIVFSDVTYTWVRVPVGAFLRNTHKDSLLGKINDAVFDTGTAPGDVIDGGGYAWPTGTLLYTGYDDSNRYYDANEDWVVDVVFNFRFRQIGWNRYLNNEGKPVEVSLTGTSAGEKPYGVGDFNTLFTVG